MTKAPTSPPDEPLISVAMPTHDPKPRHLRAAIDSVRRQIHRHWELCIVDDASTRDRVERVLGACASADPRIRVERLPANRGIAAASNRAVAMCRGEHVAFLDHDDTLSTDALKRVAAAIEADPSLDVIYSDQDKLDRRGRRVAPFLKPDWSPVYALGAMYVGHLLVVRRSLLDAIGGFDPSFDTIQDFELLLRLSERTDRIHHLRRILYHWRAAPGSIAAGVDEKSGVPALQARAVSEHLRRRGIRASAEPHPEIPHRARLVPAPRREHPPVSVVVPWSGDARRLAGCLASALDRASYPALEVIVAAPRGTKSSVPRGGRGATIASVQVPGDASAPSALNLGAERASGEHLIFLADDLIVLDRDWIEHLLLYAEMPSVGVVGPLLLHPDGRVHASGLALRRWEVAGERPEPAWWRGGSPAEPIMRGLPGDGDGYYGSLSCAREVAALPGACMMLRRSVLAAVGGFSERYRSRYHDADLCLRVRELGLDAVCTPQPRVERHDPAPRPDDMIDRALLIDSWFGQLDRGDPFLNPRLSVAMAPNGAASNGAGAGSRLARRA